MILFTIFGCFWLNPNYVVGSSQPQPQQVLPSHPHNPHQIPVHYGAYLQQVDAAGAQALPVQHSFTVNHSPYTFYPKPQSFYPSSVPSENENNHPPPPPFVPGTRERPIHVQQLNHQQPIQFLVKTPQYSPQQIQRNFQPNHREIPIVNPPNLGHFQYSNIPANGKVPQGHPPIQPYISQADKFRQQIPTKNAPNKPIEEKRYHHQEQTSPIRTLPPQPVRNTQKQEQGRKEDEQGEAREDTEEESEEDESVEESGSEEEEDNSQDEREAASDLPPEHNRNKYDYDNRNYEPTFDAAKYIFNQQEQPQKKPSARYYEEEVPRYHREKGFKYAYHKNTKTKPKKEEEETRENQPEPQSAKTRFVFYDSEPKFDHYEPTFEPDQPPKRIKAKRVEITNGKPTYYYYSSTDPKVNNSNYNNKSNNDNNNNTNDSKPQATRKKMIREKWYVMTKET